MTLKTAIASAALGAALLSTPAVAVEIEYWQYYFEGRVQAIDQLIEAFEAENPDITVKHTHFPYAQYRTKIAAAVMAGQGPDVVQLYYGWLPDFLKAGLLEPLPAETFDPATIDAEYFPIVKRMKVDGQYYGLPTAVRSLAMFYNKDLFTKAGLDPESPPATYEELVTAAKAIAEHDGSGNLLVAGITATPVAQDAHWWREVLIRQHGGAPYSDDGRTVTYDTPEGAAALHDYTDMFMVHDATEYGFMNESQASFAAQRAGILIDGSFRIGAVQAMEGLNWGVAPLPTQNGVSSNYASYWVNGITRGTEGEELEASLKFLEFITRPEAMQLWLEVVGELPARPSVALTEENLADPVYGPFLAGLDGAQTTEFVNESAQRQIWLDMIDRINIGGVSVEDSLAEAATAEQKLLDEFYAE
ncbi:ABC transporter substrate-binding protein [Acuticoccus sediminis]|uniref:ABC transporter substrate-binding protein n=1 Tax=Acuticoccus sediminis TaxID=2184697 RepID=A0A8B2NIG3_9HYPH|nr:extracellular solute-binding protein [Acuticoccus sediminis]RAH97311.1 ABC transporter substrate-binding protein [Acuticoccus sediminis]